MTLKILSNRGIMFDGEASAVNLKTKSGEITILNNHRPIVSILERGEVKITLPAGKLEPIAISGGFLEMSPAGMLTLLVD